MDRYWFRIRICTITARQAMGCHHLLLPCHHLLCHSLPGGVHGAQPQSLLPRCAHQALWLLDWTQPKQPSLHHLPQPQNRDLPPQQIHLPVQASRWYWHRSGPHAPHGHQHAPADGHLFFYLKDSCFCPLMKMEIIWTVAEAAKKAGLNPHQGHSIHIGSTLDQHWNTVPFHSIRTAHDFLFFQQISKITINREKIIGGVNEHWVWRVTFELNEMVQYLLRGTPFEVMEVKGCWAIDTFLVYLTKHTHQ